MPVDSPPFNSVDRLSFYDFREWAEPDNESFDAGLALHAEAIPEVIADGGPLRFYLPAGTWWAHTRFRVVGDNTTLLLGDGSPRPPAHGVELFGDGVHTVLKAAPGLTQSLFIVENSHYFRLHDLVLDGNAENRPAVEAFDFTASASTVNVSGDRFTVDATAAGFESLMLAQFSGADLPQGISPGVNYWMRDVSATGFKLSLSAAGPYVAIDDTGSGTVTVTPIGEAAQPGGDAGDNFRLRWNAGINGGAEGVCESPVIWNVLSRGQPHKDIGSFVIGDCRNGFAHTLIVEGGDRSPFTFWACEHFTGRNLVSHQSLLAAPSDFSTMDDNVFILNSDKVDVEFVSHMPHAKQGRNVYVYDSRRVRAKFIGDGSFRGGVVIEAGGAGELCEDIEIDAQIHNAGEASSSGSSSTAFGGGVEIVAAAGGIVRRVKVRGSIINPSRSGVRFGNPNNGSDAAGLIEDVDLEDLLIVYDDSLPHAVAPYSAAITNVDYNAETVSPTPLRRVRIKSPVIRGFRRGGIDLRGVEDLLITDYDVRDCGAAGDAFPCAAVRAEDCIDLEIRGGRDKGADHDHGLYLVGNDGELVVLDTLPSSVHYVAGALTYTLVDRNKGWDI